MATTQKGFSGILLLVGMLVIGAFTGFGYYYYLSLNSDKPLTYKNQSNKTLSKLEIAKRTYYKNGNSSEILEEKSQRNADGSLETVVTSNNKKLSHHLYTKDFIIGLSNGVLNFQELKSGANKTGNYFTTGENILRFVRQNTNLPKTSISLNGKKTEVYTIGAKKATSFSLIKAAIAQSHPNSLVKVYVDESTGELKKIEQLPTEGVQPEEVIEYSNGPVLLKGLQIPEYGISSEEFFSPSTAIETDIVSQLPQLALKDQLLLIEEKLVKDLKTEEKESLEEIMGETTEVKAISIQPAIVPDGAIYLNPLSTIPTPSGYNSPILLLSSTLFNQQSKLNQVIGTTNSFDMGLFINDNVKIRIDGSEIPNKDTFLEPGSTTSLTEPWVISSLIPKGLAPGYHTVEVFMVDSWYQAPNLLVTLPRPDEKVLEIELFINPPPFATKLPNDQGYRVVLKGNNFIKPFTVSLDNTVLDDKLVEVNGSGELVLTIPPTIPSPQRGPAYSVTITKDGQKAFRPSLLILGASSLPPPPSF